MGAQRRFGGFQTISSADVVEPLMRSVWGGGIDVGLVTGRKEKEVRE